MTSTTSVKVSELHRYASGLNIEGGYPGLDSKQWVNLVTVLDRPIIDHVVFDTILDTARSLKYNLLENAVLEFDESKMLVTYIAVIAFYMNKYSSITVHVHQFPEFTGLLKLIQSFVLDARQYMGCETKVKYTMDNPTYQRGYQTGDTDITISLSQCAGLDPTLEPGAFIVPDTFIPFDNGTINVKSEYKVQNLLLQEIDEIIASKYHQMALRFVKQYKSDNILKKHEARPLTRSDFHFKKILQTSGIWNPTDADVPVRIVE